MEQLRIEIPEIDTYEKNCNEAFVTLREIGNYALVACHVGEHFSPADEIQRARDHIETMAQVGIAKGYTKKPLEREEA